MNIQVIHVLSFSGMSDDGKSPTVAVVKGRASLGGAMAGKSPGLGVNSVKSPGLGLGGVNIKSPNSGLRVGLSRNMKLKSLHPNLKVQNWVWEC